MSPSGVSYWSLCSPPPLTALMWVHKLHILHPPFNNISFFLFVTTLEPPSFCLAKLSVCLFFPPSSFIFCAFSLSSSFRLSPVLSICSSYVMCRLCLLLRAVSSFHSSWVPSNTKEQWVICEKLVLAEYVGQIQGGYISEHSSCVAVTITRGSG